VSRGGYTATRGRKVSPAMAARIGKFARLFGKASGKEIAALVGCSQTAISYYALERGLPTRLGTPRRRHTRDATPELVACAKNAARFSRFDRATQAQIDDAFFAWLDAVARQTADRDRSLLACAEHLRDVWTTEWHR